VILLVSNKEDFTADRVVAELDRRGACFARLNTEDFPTSIRCQYRLGVEGLTAWFNLGHGRWVDIREVAAVWYRRPEPSRIDSRIPPGVALELARRESVAAMRGLLALADGAYWVNRPDANRAAEHRPAQLAIAAQEGLRTPETLVTNDPHEVARFQASVGGPTVVKTVGPAFVNPISRKQIFTSVVGPEHLGFIKDIAFAPVLLQEYIPKRLELRVTIVGKRVLTAAIDSQSSPVTRDDWRRDVFDAPHHVYALPDDVSDQCLRLARRFGLVFAALDLILTPDGEYVFLDLNPNGEWDWVEAMTGLPVAAAVADVLCALE
jgi:glutathione synthase/RimK-type ligase-like ATP-grasp enzyme